MDTFSWRDAARAVFGPCLHCIPSARKDNSDDEQQRPRGARLRDGLESLLQNPGFSDGEMDADALSLYSHPGRSGARRPRKKRGKKKGSIRLFGYDLFGRPIQLDEDSDVDNRADDQRRISRISSSTLDSDAAPLTDETILQLSVEADTRREADEARKARKERRKQKKVAALLSTQTDDFEGFPGSGGVAVGDEFGAFQTAPPGGDPDPDFVHVEGGGVDEADAEADFDATSYVRNAARRSDSGSGSRSRTSASMSNAQEPPILPHRVPLPPSSRGSSATRRKKPKKSGKRSATTESTGTSSQPRSPTVFDPTPHVGVVSPTWTGNPQQAAKFEGVPPDDDFSPPPPHSKLTGQTVHGDTVFQNNGFPSPGLTSGGGFPSVGFNHSEAFPSPGLGGRRKSSSFGGAFLARTGDDA